MCCLCRSINVTVLLVRVSVEKTFNLYKDMCEAAAKLYSFILYSGIHFFFCLQTKTNCLYLPGSNNHGTGLGICFNVFCQSLQKKDLNVFCCNKYIVIHANYLVTDYNPPKQLYSQVFSVNYSGIPNVYILVAQILWNLVNWSLLPKFGCEDKHLHNIWVWSQVQLCKKGNKPRSHFFVIPLFKMQWKEIRHFYIVKQAKPCALKFTWSFCLLPLLRYPGRI